MNFILDNQLAFVAISLAMQFIGTFFLSLFSFKGLKIKEKSFFIVDDEPFTSVEIDNAWLLPGKLGMVCLLAGILLGGIVTFAQILNQ